MAGFVVNIDLSAYFEDLRKYASVFVDLSHCKSVGDVEKHIKSVFKLDDNICLTTSVYAEDFLIPRSEDVNILKQQQIKVFKVQKCDFYDHQIHKDDQRKILCDQTALNLIHSDRTIDLSCRPKQRLKLNSNHNNCKHVSSMHILTGNNEIKKLNDNYTNSSQAQTKEKQKFNKKKLDIENEIFAENDILDMSFNKNKSKYYDNCFFSNRSVDEINDLDISENNEDGPVYNEYHKKAKKRKHYSNDKDDVDLANSCWKAWVPDGDNCSSSKKHKKAKEKKNDYLKTETITDFCVHSNEETPDTITDFCVHSNEETPHLQKKRKKENKCLETLESFNNNCEDKYDTSTNQDFDSTFIKPKRKLKKNVHCIEETIYNLEDVQYEFNASCVSKTKHLNNQLDLGTQQEFEETNSLVNENVTLSVQSSPLISEKECSSYPTNDQNKEASPQNVSNSCSQLLDKNPKRKRVRKHNKKKKRERHFTGVGEIINRLSTPPKVSLPRSEVAKHVFFTEDDVIEELNIPTETVASENLVSRGGESQTKDEKSLHNGIPRGNEDDGLQLKQTTWQDELLKLTSSESKPIIFHRVSTPPLDYQKKESPSILPTQEDPVKSLLGNSQNVSRAHYSQGHQVILSNEKCNGEINPVKTSDGDSVSKINKTEIKIKSDGLQTFSIDTENIVLTNYPIIDKVVVNDLILFKILKMNETEPGLSKTILAKVKGTTNFPDKISLQIMGGCDECEHGLPESSDLNCAKKEELNLEFRWVEIFEPRLFYP